MTKKEIGNLTIPEMQLLDDFSTARFGAKFCKLLAHGFKFKTVSVDDAAYILENDTLRSNIKLATKFLRCLVEGMKIQDAMRYYKEDFSEDQLRAIADGSVGGLSKEQITVFADTDLDANQMMEICYRMINGASIEEAKIVAENFKNINNAKENVKKKGPRISEIANDKEVHIRLMNTNSIPIDDYIFTKEDAEKFMSEDIRDRMEVTMRLVDFLEDTVGITYVNLHILNTDANNAPQSVVGNKELYVYVTKDENIALVAEVISTCAYKGISVRLMHYISGDPEYSSSYLEQVLF